MVALETRSVVGISPMFAKPDRAPIVAAIGYAQEIGECKLFFNVDTAPLERQSIHNRKDCT